MRKTAVGFGTCASAEEVALHPLTSNTAGLAWPTWSAVIAATTNLRLIALDALDDLFMAFLCRTARGCRVTETRSVDDLKSSAR